MKKVGFISMLIISLTFVVITGNSFAAKPSDIEKLGEALYMDENLSLNGNQSCMTCHHPLAGFGDTSNHVDPINSPVSDGSDPGLFGGRNAPSAAYAGFSPPLGCAPDGEGGLFCTGGMFWDGRATGQVLTDTGSIMVYGAQTGATLDPLADQAKGPFQNSVEMALTPEQLIDKVRAGSYAGLFMKVFGYNVATEPAEIVYNDIGIAIAAFERSTKLNTFSSKFDQFANEQTGKGVLVNTIAMNPEGVVVDGTGKPITTNIFMKEELEGLALFNMPNDNDGFLEIGEGGNCAACHPTGPITEPTDSQGQTLFTDFSYDNLGVPVNTKIADLAGPQSQDLGLFTTLTGLLGHSTEEADGTQGVFKVPTLRNVAQTAPYAHNGFFPTLKSIVHFYNTRDVLDFGDPEVPETINDVELGNLDLLPVHEERIVLFMETLTDR